MLVKYARRLLGMLGLVAVALTLVATTANAAALPILHSGQTGSGQEAHSCTVIGSDGTTEGVVCIDILTGIYDSNSGEGTYARSQIELLCQNISSGATVQCADAVGTWGVYDAAGDGTSDNAECGHSYGACSTGRNYYKGNTIDYPWSEWSDSNCDTNVSAASDAWAVAYGSGDTRIELPGSDDWVYLNSGSGANDGSNESTGHFFICI